MVLTAGMHEPNANVEQYNKVSGTAIAKGKVLVRDAAGDNTWKVAATSSKGPFAVCKKAAASTDLRVDVVTRGVVAVTADGAIKPGALVAVSGSTAGEVIAYTVGTGDDDLLKVIGRYIGKESSNVREGSTAIPDAADGDIIYIEMSGF